ncbi:PA_1 and RING-H2_PA-TM-RING domain-containing protein [Emydomyces testavorans]|uniref:RING-type E3 ubiquitin transferase n=1 Tax=Emydomyces testavorans TaxID=2070801 RepID=A0AAF0DLT0_9EURO|nr:PA_1 and RING-H2_PA-TM-RING domain-containing protein [Emydomyces testavorans]
MRPPRLIILLACFIFLPIFLTTLSLLSARPRHGAAATSPASQRTSRLRALFSFNAPSALFPPSAIINLTEDNSTFFLARPAAFGPLLPSKGLSGPLWIGSGFIEDALRKAGVGVAAEGELGCSDVPGWEGGGKSQTTQFGAGPQHKNTQADKSPGQVVALDNRGKRGSAELDRAAGTNGPSEGDGTDDHLHHPLPQSDAAYSNPNGGTRRPNDNSKDSTHADIQSLQESAEISGKIVLLSRGGCGFLEKVKWAQRRGGIAVIVGDDTRGGGLVTMYARGDTSNVTIPSVFTSYTTAHLLSSLVPPDKSSETLKAAPKERKPKKKPNFKSGKSTGTKASSSSATTSLAKSNSGFSPGSRGGFFSSFASFLGFSQHNGFHSSILEDSRRPPSSGNLDWPSRDQPGQETKSNKHVDGNGPPRGGNSPDPPQSGSDDDFVIGVQDWRDPDLVPVKTSASNVASATAIPGAKAKGNSGQKSDASKQSLDSSGLKGGSITPRSGEYKISKDDNNPNGPRKDKSSGSQGGHWWNEPFGSKHDDNPTIQKTNKLSQFGGAAGMRKSHGHDGDQGEREGLWVTLTPTTMSTSPFFDTLLVLVVSPLITLTVVYALLLLRSRIRRRRWRAPKAIVDRLPVRTYHTMSTVSTPSTVSPRTSSPSSPLLSHSPPHSPRPRPRSQTCGPVSASSNSLDPGRDRAQKPRSGSTLWRRKYTGRQVECVVCLEEYIDGQSRVMSLPCGHEFHVECITPWLTTRRRTCPICKGDVVRSLGAAGPGASRDPTEPTSDDGQARIAEARNDSPTSAIPIPEDDLPSDLEPGITTSASLPGGSQEPTASQSSWRDLANLSLSTLSGDSMWHQPRHTRSHRNR